MDRFTFPRLTTFELSATPEGTFSNEEGFPATQLLDFLEATPTLESISLAILAEISLVGIPPERIVILPNVEKFYAVEQEKSFGRHTDLEALHIGWMVSTIKTTQPACICIQYVVFMGCRPIQGETIVGNARARFSLFKRTQFFDATNSRVPSVSKPAVNGPKRVAMMWPHLGDLLGGGSSSIDHASSSRVAVSLGTSPDPAPRDLPHARVRVLSESAKFCKGRVAAAKFVIRTTT